MTLLAGDLTTLARVKDWLPAAGSGSDPILTQLISRCTALIYNHLNRSRLYSQPFVRYFNGVGTNSIVLPDWPVTQIAEIQVGSVLVPQSALPVPNQSQLPSLSPGYGFRFAPWAGNLPGDPAVVELVNGWFWPGNQNVKVAYTAGYAERDEPGTIPVSPGPYTITVLQPQGIWCRDNGVVYASSGIALIPVTTL